MRPDGRDGENQVNQRVRTRVRPDRSVVSAMGNEERAQILILLNERVASKPEIAKELGLAPDKVRYELDVLKKMNPPLVKLEFERPVRGTVEKFYRATKRAYLSPDEWPGVPDAVKASMRGGLLDILVKDAVAAVDQGKFDALPEAHMSWTPAILDEKGWTDIVAILFRTMNEVIEVKEQSAQRLDRKDAKGVSCTVSILGYASANEDRKVGPPREG
jgi:DNA-binding transcriptional ArsR family regulator